MTQPAIRVQNISKQYQIGLRETANQTFREAITSTITAPFRRFQKLAGGKTRESDHFMALTDVSFDVQPGEVVGIIGRNGAGKSTLLKILSRITEPTSGRIELNGRVASLLEVGTGFHPELTGRENVYLNGAILGMTKAEIKRKFDEIVAFSEVDRFLDTPVKKYSSGMKVRLAFSVAAHLDPEILIIDEVLAVGDAAFQDKCLGKMDAVAHEGRTVLFVSHNMPAVSSLTSRCVWLDGGKIAETGETHPTLDSYLATLRGTIQKSTDFATSQRQHAHHGTQYRILSIRPQYTDTGAFCLFAPLVFAVELSCNRSDSGIRLGATITDMQGSPILTTVTPHDIRTQAGYKATCELVISQPRLAPGKYHLALSVGVGDLTIQRTNYDLVRPGPLFEVGELSADGTSLYNWSTSYGSIVHEASTIAGISLRVDE